MAQTKYTTGATAPIRRTERNPSLFGGAVRSTRDAATSSNHETSAIDDIVSGSHPLVIDTTQRFVIYVLLLKGEPVYVGQSSQVETRVATHAKTKEFDRYWFTEVPESELSLLEARYIVALNPRLNMVLPNQSEFLTEASAREALGKNKMKKAVKMGVLTEIVLNLGSVYPAGQVAAAVELLGAK